MYYAYDLLKDKVIYKTESQQLLLKALGMNFEQNGFEFEKIYKRRYVITKDKPTSKRFNQEEKIKIIVSDFSLEKRYLKDASEDELELIENKINSYKISRIYWLLYLNKTKLTGKKRKKHFSEQLVKILTNESTLKKDLQLLKLKDLEEIDEMLETESLDTVSWYHFLERIIEWKN